MLKETETQFTVTCDSGGCSCVQQLPKAEAVKMRDFVSFIRWAGWSVDEQTRRVACKDCLNAGNI